MVYVGGGSLGKNALKGKYAMFLLEVIVHVHVDNRWFIGEGRDISSQPAGADLVKRYLWHHCWDFEI